jgi:hypothetical protein
MNDKRVAMGALVWCLGILLPAVHHAVLFSVTAHLSGGQWVQFSQSITQALPPFEWLYMLGMAIVGLTLVISGIRNKVRT